MEERLSAVSDETRSQKKKNLIVIMLLECPRLIRVSLINLLTQRLERDSRQRKVRSDGAIKSC